MRGDPEAADDDALVRRVALGSEDALAALYDRHAGTILRTARRLGADHGIAEEVVQETFLALWNHAERFDPDLGTLAGWLATVARHQTINRYRAASRRVPTTSMTAVTGDGADAAETLDWLLGSGRPTTSSLAEPSPEALVVGAELDQGVARALAALTPDERAAIELAYAHGLSQSEIAARLGWPLGTVKTRSRRALRRLRDALEHGPLSTDRSIVEERRDRRDPVPCGAA